MDGELDRILSREASLAEKYAVMDKYKIGVVGISPGAGVGFLTGCLARYLANTGKHNPAVVELGKGSLFDSYGMDKRFAGRSWFRFYESLKANKSTRGMQNMDEGINWILISPDEAGVSLSFEEKLMLAVHARGDVILCDLSGERPPDFQLLRSMDQIIAVIDPMPSKMLGGYPLLCSLKALETERGNMIYAINKMNRGVNSRQMSDFLNVHKPVFLPLVNPESVYTAEYNCKIPYAVGEVKNVLRGALAEIVSMLMI